MTAQSMSDHTTTSRCGCTAPNAHSVVAVFHAHTEAEDAVKSLQKAGFDMTKLSIIGRDYHAEEHVVGYYNTGEISQARDILQSASSLETNVHRIGHQ